MAARNGSFVKPFFELFQKKSSYHLFLDGRRIRLLNLLTLTNKGQLFFISISALEPAGDGRQDPVIPGENAVDLALRPNIHNS